ncbi:hypothetical protein [Mycoplasmopsis columbinasalis]|nr:hypothetical protein [Mycoplasmopsis columbinasalis]
MFKRTNNLAIELTANVSYALAQKVFKDFETNKKMVANLEI